MIFDEYSRATVHLTSSGHVRKLESPHARWRLAIQIRVDHVATTMFLFISVGLHGMSTFLPQSLSIEVQDWTSITWHFMAGTGRSSKHVLRGCHNLRRFPAIAPHSANRTLFFFFFRFHFHRTQYLSDWLLLSKTRWQRSLPVNHSRLSAAEMDRSFVVTRLG